MNAILRFISNIPWWVPFLGALVMGYMGFQSRMESEVKPIDEQKTQYEQEITKVKEEIERVKKFEAEKDQKNKEEADLEKAFKASKAQFPPNIDLPDLMKSFEDIARKLNVRITQFTPDMSVKRELLSSSKVTLKISGTYIQGMQFMNELAKMTRVINVESVRFSGAKPDPGGQIVDIEYSMVTFFVGDA